MTPDETIAQQAGESARLPGVSVEDGKYTVQMDVDGRLRCLRYGQEWRDLTGDKMVLAFAQEVQSLRADLARERELKILKEKEASALSHAGFLVTEECKKEKARADALEKEFARMKEAIINVCSGIDDGGSNFKSVPEMLVALKQREQLSAESRLAAMQKHADGLAARLQETDEKLTSLAAAAYGARGPSERVQIIFASNKIALKNYRAFTAEREKEKK